MISAFKVENNKFERTSLISINYIIFKCTFQKYQRPKGASGTLGEPRHTAENFLTNQSRLQKNSRRANAPTHGLIALKLPNSKGS